MEENLFDLIIQKRKNKETVKIPEGKENECLTTDTIVIGVDLADKILTVGQEKDESKKMEGLREIFKSFKDVERKEYEYDLDDIYTFYFRRHK